MAAAEHVRAGERSIWWWVAALSMCLIILILVSFGIGRYYLDPVSVIGVLYQSIFPNGEAPGSEQIVLLEIRLPRILAAVVVGSALAACGAAYQAMFRNPLVSPEILGVSNGAGFGASIGILMGLPPGIREVLAFSFGLLAAVLSLGIARAVGSGLTVVIVLGGIVVGTMFGAMISTTQFFANPETTLPEITFWLFGSLARATLDNLLAPALIVIAGLAVFYLLRWPMTVLSTGDDQAQSLGVERRLVLIIIVVASTLMTAAVVSLSGIIGWVGLLIPHVARMLVGPLFNRVLPVSAILGAIFLLSIDNVARSATALDLPLGILTALIGAPFFVILLMRMGRQWQ